MLPEAERSAKFSPTQEFLSVYSSRILMEIELGPTGHCQFCWQVLPLARGPEIYKIKTDKQEIYCIRPELMWTI